MPAPTRPLFHGLMAAVLVASGVAPAAEIRLSDYCTTPAAADHTSCIAAWLDAGRASPSRKLYAGSGVYRYAAAATLYSGMHLECQGATSTVFRSIGGNGTFLTAAAPVTDIDIRHCGFDVNGNPAEFLAVIAVNPQTTGGPSSHLRVRNSRFFDGTLSGGPSASQRQYVLLLDCHDCRVIQNHLSGGGRIKVGRPGRNLEIRHNVVEFANDNAITVVDVTPNGVSANIVIANNRIFMPLGVGIFLGADGQATPAASMTTRDVDVTDNHVEGNWATACIQATLPGIAQRIRVRGNTCIKTAASVPYAAGISVSRTDDATAPSSGLHIERNTIAAAPAIPAGTTLLDYGGIFVKGNHDDVRIRHNTVRDVSARAIFIAGTLTQARVTPNTLTGGSLVVTGSVSP